MTFGPFSTAQSFSGLFLADDIAAGNAWFYGTLTTARTVAAGQAMIVAAGALTISLA
jgi:hypothetical protein